MSLATMALVGWGVIAALMAVLWYVQYRRRNAGIVDIAWAFGTGLLGVYFALGSSSVSPERQVMVALMAGLWGLRLAGFLAVRIASEREDGRYRYLRELLGARVQPAMFGFFQLQAVWAVLFAMPMWAAVQSERAGLGWPDLLGAGLWLGAMIGEAIADRQLARFRADPANRGKVCQAGLWRYSRHPNYFFEWLHWWAYVFIGLGSGWWWVTVAGMLGMYVFITRVTGFPYTEKQAIRSRGDAYREYQRTTSAFFPRPPNRQRQEQPS